MFLSAVSYAPTAQSPIPIIINNHNQIVVSKFIVKIACEAIQWTCTCALLQLSNCGRGNCCNGDYIAGDLFDEEKKP